MAEFYLNESYIRGADEGSPQGEGEEMEGISIQEV